MDDGRSIGRELGRALADVLKIAIDPKDEEIADLRSRLADAERDRDRLIEAAIYRDFHGGWRWGLGSDESQAGTDDRESVRQAVLAAAGIGKPD
jgi:hypothetical protein